MNQKTTDIQAVAESVQGVQYAIIYGNHLRVVFRHNASTDSVREVSQRLGCVGKLGATQEHLPSADYPLDRIDA